MLSSDLNAAYDIVGKKMFGGSITLDMSDILIYKGDLENLERRKRGGDERKEMLRLCKSHLMGVAT